MTKLLVLAIALAFALTGCGETQDPSVTPPAGSPTPSEDPSVQPAQGTISLRVEVRADEQADPEVSTVTCKDGKAAGTGALSSDPEAACANARKNRDLLVEGPAKDRICTEIYGGPQTARVTGSIDGDEVDLTFKRSNGCEISDWETLEPLLGPPPGASD